MLLLLLMMMKQIAMSVGDKHPHAECVRSLTTSTDSDVNEIM